MDNQKRHSVGVMIGGVHSYFTREMIRGMVAQAREEELNAFFFLRIHTKPFFQSILGDFSSNIYDYQFNTIHDYCSISGADGFIIGYGTIGFHLNKDDSDAFARRFNSRPLVIVSEKVDLPNCHNIIADNYHGMYDMITHLIEVHGCRKILFMRGPKRNVDAVERLQGYLEAMQAHGLTVADFMIGNGDFSSYRAAVVPPGKDGGVIPVQMKADGSVADDDPIHPADAAVVVNGVELIVIAIAAEIPQNALKEGPGVDPQEEIGADVLFSCPGDHD